MKSFVVLYALHYLKLRLSFLGCTLILPQRLIWEVLYTSESIFRVFLLLSRAPYLPASRHCSVFVSSAWLARLMATFSIRIQYHFRLLSLSLSRSSWLLLSVLILALDSSFCKFVPWKRFVKSMGPSHRKLTKNNLASFCLWPPCCHGHVVLTRPRAIPLAMITMRKSIHWFPLFSYIAMGLHGVPLLTESEVSCLNPGSSHCFLICYIQVP